ncbi:MAG: DUF1836 domain-containing protein [Clostridiaceae bacterium]
MKTINELLTLPKIEEIPDFGLYMDQVITFMQRKYPAKPLTKTMINNYTKDKILFPPLKKKYLREHLMLLSIIQILKRTLSLPEIKMILGPISNDLEKGTLSSLYELYEGFHQIYGDVIQVAEEAASKASKLTTDHNLRILSFALLSAYFSNLSEDDLTHTEENPKI